MVKKIAPAWKPGQSGNPAGRPKGIKNPNTKLREAIAKHVPAIIDELVQAAMGGDVAAAKLLIERVLPPSKAVEEPIAFTLPEGSLSDRARAVIDSVANGVLSVGSGSQLLAGLGTLAKIVETDELAQRITLLEQQHGNA